MLIPWTKQQLNEFYGKAVEERESIITQELVSIIKNIRYSNTDSVLDKIEEDV